MSTIGWRVHGDGRRILPGAVVNPDERLSWPRTVGIGMQHVVAMFGATILVPAITGFPASTTLFFSAVGTVLFLVITGNRLPSYLGSSFAFIAPVLAAMASGGVSVATGGILVGGVVGYLAAWIQGEVNFDTVKAADWVGFPHFTGPTFDLSVLGLFLPVVFVLIAENVGHVKSVAAMTGKNYDPLIGRALMSDGIATTLAGLGGGSGTTTYAENIGVMAATKVYSTAAYWVAAATALLLSLSPKFGALVGTVPAGVLGGAGTVLYGMIAVLGGEVEVGRGDD